MFALPSILALNATSCVLFGLLFLALPGTVAAFLGTPPAPAWLIAAIGAVLLANGAHLAWAARRQRPRRALVLYFSGGDIAWVIATLALIAAGVWINTPGGIAVALIVAMAVGAMGVLQWRASTRT
ncbi:MAG: hypothetical protein U5K33_07205 [Halofilum sp. (in: g-proteobacteria)]|nr:hypothetical protein [Halofilum sp. (in: g-proteobacteria)]